MKKLYSIILLSIIVLLILQIIILLKTNKQSDYSDLQIWSVGKYYIDKTSADYNSLKKENDLYSCLNNNYLFYYGVTWNQYCQDLQLEKNCTLPDNLQESIRELHTRMEAECYRDNSITDVQQ